MMGGLREQLTSQFYAWEVLGRGWLLAQEPVELEAPFTPFYGHVDWRAEGLQDDGIPRTTWNRLVAFFQCRKREERLSPPPLSYDPFLFEDGEALVHLQLHLSRVEGKPTVQMAQVLSLLSYPRHPLSFEIVATRERIQFQLTLRAPDQGFVQNQLRAFFPGVQVTAGCDAFTLPAPYTDTIDFGLEQEWVRPLTGATGLHPLTGLFILMENLGEEETLLYQALFQGTVNQWAPHAMGAVGDGRGGCFFANAPDMLPLARQKVARPLLAATVRLAASTPSSGRTGSLLQDASFSLTKAFLSSNNTLLALPDEGYGLQARLHDLCSRTSRRTGMLLNTDELTLLVDLPSRPAKKMLGTSRKTKALPDCLGREGITLGVNDHGGRALSAHLSLEQRYRHIHILGATGTGKSTLLFELIRQDMRLGHGVAVLDPHGDLVDKLLGHIPRRRAGEVVLIDPSDTAYPVAFNVLQAASPIEKEILSSDLVAVFRRQATSWGDQMNSVLANAILAFLESSEGGTLLDLRRFLLEKAFRQALLLTVGDEDVHYYWERQFPLLKTTSIGPILTRLDGFLRPRIIRNMVRQKRGLDFEGLLNTRKIILVKLPQGLIGEENAYLLGTFLVAKLQQAAMARQVMEKEKRSPFFLYLDEFHHFATPTLASILSGARKYHLGLTLAHQNLQQLQKADGELLSSVLSNAGTRICFRVGESDARVLEKGFSFFEATDLQSLSTGEAIARVEQPASDFSLRVLPAGDDEEDVATSEEVLAQSRKKYASAVPLPTEPPAVATPARKKAPLENAPGEGSRGVAPPEAEASPDPPRLPPVEEFPTPLSSLSDAAAPSLPTEGEKELSRHRYLQALVKQMAEAKGFRAFTEAVTPDGHGSVDVAIEREGLRMACEISVTSPVEWEAHNIEKCLKAGYDLVVVCISDGKNKAAFQKAFAACFDDTSQNKIRVMEVEELLGFLSERAPQPQAAQTLVKGYRVKVAYQGGNTGMKKETVSRLVAEGLKRNRKP